MAATVGKHGSVRYSTADVVITLVDSWSLNPSIDTVEITAYGSSFKDRTSTLKDWSASFTATLDRTDTGQANIFKRFETGSTFDENLAIRFFTSSIAYWGGNIIPTGIPISSKVGDKVSITVNGAGNGVLAYVTGT